MVCANLAALSCLWRGPARWVVVVVLRRVTSIGNDSRSGCWREIQGQCQRLASLDAPGPQNLGHDDCKTNALYMGCNSFEERGFYFTNNCNITLPTRNSLSLHWSIEHVDLESVGHSAWDGSWGGDTFCVADDFTRARSLDSAAYILYCRTCKDIEGILVGLLNRWKTFSRWCWTAAAAII